MSYDYKQEHFIAAVKEVCANENVEVKQADSGMLYFVAKSSFLLSGDGKKVLSPYQKIHQLAEITTKIENAEKAAQDAQDRLQRLKAEKDELALNLRMLQGLNALRK